MKQVLVYIAVFLGLAFAHTGHSQTAPVTGDALKQLWVLPKPVFPAVNGDMLAPDFQATVVVGFTITSTGNTENVKIVSIEPETLDPEPYLATMRKATYVPAEGNTERKAVYTTHTFTLGGANRAAPKKN